MQGSIYFFNMTNLKTHEYIEYLRKTSFSHTLKIGNYRVNYSAFLDKNYLKYILFSLP